MIQILVDLFFLLLLKVHRSLINVAQAFACLIVQNNWNRRERLLYVHKTRIFMSQMPKKVTYVEK